MTPTHLARAAAHGLGVAVATVVFLELVLLPLVACRSRRAAGVAGLGRPFAPAAKQGLLVVWSVLAAQVALVLASVSLRQRLAVLLGWPP